MRILKDLTGQLWTLTYKLCTGCWSASITVVFRHQLFSSILKLFCPLFYRINDPCRPLSYLIVIGDGQFTVDCRWQSEVSPLLATGCWMRRPDNRAGAIRDCLGHGGSSAIHTLPPTRSQIPLQTLNNNNTSK